ncbi:hypothetical protein NMG60_11003226 [Bertholletia excelsa]
MMLLSILRSHHFHKLLKLQNLPRGPGTLPHHGPFSILQRTVYLSAQFEHKSTCSDSSTEEIKKTKKPLHLLFKEAVGILPKLDPSDSESEDETNELKKKLRKLEKEVRKLKEDNDCKRESVRDLKKTKSDDGISTSDSKPKSLSELFRDKASGTEKSADTTLLGMEDPMVYKELSPDMVLFVRHLYKKGYFVKANFFPRKEFDVSCFENSYGRDFIKFAAEKFGKDNQDIAKWLSGSDLKKVASFGCPSLGRKNVFSAKRLRLFFGIQEDTVCSKCVLKSSCKFVNQSIWKGDYKILNLAVVMRVITLYALESVPPQLIVPDEIKASVNRLLKEVVNLSETHA